ncbi:MAG: hypothetical protein P1S60_14750 [Anaerolineae bacterium]|nr:hypothetical protein [Anaerolineae bacterium]
MEAKGERPQYNSILANHPKPAISLTAITYLVLGLLETLPGTFLPAFLYFFALGILALYLMPTVLGLPKGRKPFSEYARDIRLVPLTPVGRNVLLGLGMAGLTLSSIFLAALLTGHFALDWSLVPAVVHDIFVLFVQNTPGADEFQASALLFGFLWAALIIGAFVTKVVVERWPTEVATVTKTAV